MFRISNGSHFFCSKIGVERKKKSSIFSKWLTKFMSFPEVNKHFSCSTVHEIYHAHKFIMLKCQQ